MKRERREERDRKREFIQNRRHCKRFKWKRQQTLFAARIRNHGGDTGSLSSNVVVFHNKRMSACGSTLGAWERERERKRDKKGNETMRDRDTEICEERERKRKKERWLWYQDREELLKEHTHDTELNKDHKDKDAETLEGHAHQILTNPVTVK